MIETLLQNGADPNLFTEHRIIPLVLSAQMQNQKAVERLCEAHAEVDATDARGMSALMYASWFACKAIVDALITYGADVNLRGPGGWTPLMFAAHASERYGDSPELEEIVSILVRSGASEMARDAHGRIAADIAGSGSGEKSRLVSRLSRTREPL